MDENMNVNKKEKRVRRKKPPRQAWKPNVLLRLLHFVWMTAFTAFKIAVGAAATVLCICVVCGVVFIGLLGQYLESDIVPEAANFALENYDLDETSFLYYLDNNGDIQLQQRIFADTNRQWAPIDQIPEDLIHAAIAIEDKRFYEHQGVDWITTVKACLNMFFGSSDTFGGSTITQQLIKNLTTEDSITVQRKVMEIFRAQSFEKLYDKDVVMEWYLNTIYMGNGCAGVKSAAAVYFGKELQSLTVAECASLISITNNPSLYDPYRTVDEDEIAAGKLSGREQNKARQMKVLGEMLDQEWISKAQYDEAKEQILVFKSGISDDDRIVTCADCQYSGERKTFDFLEETQQYHCPQCGEGTTVETDASQSNYSWFVDTVLEDVAQAMAEKDGMEWNSVNKKLYLNMIRKGGYHIYTTLDMDVQKQVDTIYTNLDEIPDTRSAQQLQSAIVVIDNRTGDIVAMSGGVGEKIGFDEWNRAVDARLQTGSSIKPLTIYAPAFESGAVSPATVVSDMPLNYDNGAFPLNDSRTYSFSRTVLSGVISSINGIAVNTLDMIGTSYSYYFAKDKFRLSGLTSHYVRESDGMVMSDEDYSPLGMGALTLGVSVRDMSSAFAVFANNGVYREGRTFTKVYDSEGNLVLDKSQETEQILSEKTVNYMNYCLYNAVRRGTGTAAYFGGTEICGKTGTTSSNKDRWFCGYTGYYTAAVWCGYDNPEQIYLVGSYDNPAAVLWKKVMQPLHAGKTNIELFSSRNMGSYSICLDSGKIATEACRLDVRTLVDFGRTADAKAYREDAPSGYCDKHVLVHYCVTGGGVANDYCQLFAAAGAAEVKEMSLVKMTQQELDALRRAKPYRLEPEFLLDNYIYLVDRSGRPQNFRGFDGNANVGINAPYIVCPLHTKAAWEAGPGAEPTDPTEPTEPGIDWPW